MTLKTLQNIQEIAVEVEKLSCYLSQFFHAVFKLFITKTKELKKKTLERNK